MKLIKYDNYLETGFEAIKYKPSNWKSLRVKDLISKVGSGVTPKGGSEVYIDSGIPLLRSQNVYNDGLRISDVSFIDEETNLKMKNSQLRPYDLLVNITGASIGRTCIVPPSLKKANINQHIIFLRLKKKKVDFISYYFKSPFIKDYIMMIQAGTSKEALNMGQMVNIPVIIPSFSEQTQIANYLNSKTDAIDKKIALLEKKASNYKELRKSLINETICRGLDKSAQLKDSSIDWIGQIPEHWEVKRLKDYFKLYTGNSISDKSNYEIEGNTYPYIATKDIDINSGEVDYQNGMHIPITNKSFKIAKRYSTLLCLEGGSAGRKIAFTETKVCFVNKLCCIKSLNKSAYDKYLYFLFKTTIFENQFFSILNGLIGGVSLNLLKFFDIILPTVHEQMEIVEFLENKTSKIDQITTNIKSQIETLKEFRKTLINDVVTGKIRVCEVQENELMN